MFKDHRTAKFESHQQGQDQIQPAEADEYQERQDDIEYSFDKQRVNTAFWGIIFTHGYNLWINFVHFHAQLYHIFILYLLIYRI